MKNLLDLALKLLEKFSLCDSCLGRQFGGLGYRLSNDERGRALKITLFMEAEAKGCTKTLRILASNGRLSEAGEALTRRGEASPNPKQCFVCEDVWSRVGLLADKVSEELKKYEFKTIVVGVIIPGWIAEREDQVKAYLGEAYGESIKSELSRRIGKILASRFKARFDPSKPDIQVILNPFTGEYKVTSTPIFLSGRFRKYSETLPLRSKLCRLCKGEGCGECGGLGFEKPSVEAFLRHYLAKVFKAEGVKLHTPVDDGVKRRILGLGRRFVVEVRKPKIRMVDLQNLTETFNSKYGVDFEIEDLEYTDRAGVRKVKSGFEPEAYLLLLKPEAEVSSERLREIEAELEGLKVRQRYPRKTVEVKTISKASMEDTGEFVKLTFESTSPIHVKSFIRGGADTKPTLGELSGLSWRIVRSVVYVGGLRYASV